MPVALVGESVRCSGDHPNSRAGGRCRRRVAALVAGVVGLTGAVSGARAEAETLTRPCAPLDLVLLLDTTGSMESAIDNIRDQLTEFVAGIDEASGGDYRLGLVDFGTGVRVLETFAPKNAEALGERLAGLTARGGGETREAWDEALMTVVTNRTAAEVDTIDPGAQQGDFSVSWRDEAKKIVLLVTDAGPAGFDDDYTEDDRSHAVRAAVEAAGAGIRVSTVFVPNSRSDEGAPEFLQEVAEQTQSMYYATESDGSNLTQGLQLNVETCALDSDGDGLFDIWERDGYDADGDGVTDIDLPKLGARLDHKDLFVQVNWMVPDGVGACFLFWCASVADGPHPPNQNALQRYVDFFEHAPVSNPDGIKGITVHLDAGDLTPDSGVPSGSRRGGVLASHSDYLFPDGAEDTTVVDRYRTFGFPAERAAVFTWVLYGHQIARPDDDGRMPAGRAAGIPGDEIYVAGVQMTETAWEAITLIHETGHTLGLHHGGYDDANGKPNYLSLMNYDMAWNRGVPEASGPVLDFSRAELAPLDQSNLDENAGVSAPTGEGGSLDLDQFRTFYRCADGDSAGDVKRRGPVPLATIDWNCDGDVGDTGVSGDVYAAGEDDEDRPEILSSRDDWGTLVFTGGSRGGLESAGQDYDEAGFDETAWRENRRDFSLALTGGGAVEAAPSIGVARLAFHLENIGAQADQYAVAATAKGAWEATPQVATPATLEPGGETDLIVLLPIPAGAEGVETVELRVQSAGDPDVSGLATMTVQTGTAAPLKPSGSVAFDPKSPVAGEPVDLRADGFAPGSLVLVTSTSGWFEPLSVSADASGLVGVRLQTPPEPGQDEVWVTGAGVGASADEAPRLLTGTLITSPPPDWIRIGMMALAAVLALAVGIGLVVKRLRRPRTTGRP